MKIKKIPEDFVVKEVINLDIKEEGAFTYFKLKKKNYNTLDAIDRIADSLHTHSKSITFAGNKDKFAITEQCCSIKGDKRNILGKLKYKDIEIEVLGMGDEHIYLGKLEGNHFDITIREVDSVPEVKNRFINFFGPQRFGGNNAEKGKALLTDMNKAKELLETNDVNAIPKRELQLYIHAYQSLLWNNCVKRIVEEKIDADSCPIVGFGTTYENPEVKQIVKEALKGEGITERSFIHKQVPHISSEGDERKIYAEVKDLEVGELVDHSVTLSFFSLY